MKKSIAIIAVVVSMLLVLFAVSGCSGKNIAEKIAEEAIEKAIEKDSGDNVEIDLGDGEMTIQDDDGEVTIGAGAELPDGFPGDVPVYSGMEINTSWKATDDGKDSYFISGLTGDAGDDVFAWYKDKLSGWDSDGEFIIDNGEDGKTSSLTVRDSGLVVTIMVTETKDEGTVIVQTVAEE